MVKSSFKEEFLKFFTSLVDIVYITIGTIYCGSCTKGQLIPFYLITCGSVDLACTIISLIPQTPNGWDRSKGWRSFSVSFQFIERWRSFPAQINFALFAAVFWELNNFVSIHTSKHYEAVRARMQQILDNNQVCAGNVLIYSIYEPSYESEDSPEYCNKSLYLFAVYTNLISYVAFLIIIFSNYWQDYKTREMLLRGNRSYVRT